MVNIDFFLFVLVTWFGGVFPNKEDRFIKLLIRIVTASSSTIVTTPFAAAAAARTAASPIWWRRPWWWLWHSC